MPVNIDVRLQNEAIDDKTGVKHVIVLGVPSNCDKNLAIAFNDQLATLSDIRVADDEEDDNKGKVCHILLPQFTSHSDSSTEEPDHQKLVPLGRRHKRSTEYAGHHDRLCLRSKFSHTTTTFTNNTHQFDVTSKYANRPVKQKAKRSAADAKLDDAPNSVPIPCSSAIAVPSSMPIN